MIHLPDLQSWNYYFAHVMKSCWRFVNAYKIVFTVFIYRLSVSNENKSTKNGTQHVRQKLI